MRLCVATLAAAVLVATTPAAAQISPYERAVAARQNGDPGLAVALLEPWLAEHPDDVDARVQYGYALLASGRLVDADRAFAQVLATAPDYADASAGRELVNQRRASGANVRRATLLLEGAVSDLGGGQDDWHEAGGLLNLPVAGLDTLELQAHWFSRFGREDTEFGALYTHRSGEDLWLRIGASGAPSADFRPKTGFAAGFDYRISAATVATMDASWQQFPLQQVWTLRPGVTQYFDGGRYSLSLHGRAVVAEGDDALFGGSLRVDIVPRDRTRLFIGVASGPETDLGVVSDTTSLFSGGEVPLSRSVSLLGSVAREWREIGADRSEARLGIKLAL